MYSYIMAHFKLPGSDCGVYQTMGPTFLACRRKDMLIKNEWNSRIAHTGEQTEVWHPSPNNLPATDAQDYAHVINSLTEYLGKHEIPLVCWHLPASARQRQCALPWASIG